MSEHSVPGGTVTLRDPKKVPHRLRRGVVAVTKKTFEHREAFEKLQTMSAEDAAKTLPADFMELADELSTAVIAALVESWTFGPNITPETVDELPGDAYDAISGLCMPHLNELFPSFDVSPDQKAPTGSSNV